MFEPNKFLKLERIFKIFHALDKPESALFLLKNDFTKQDYVEHCNIISHHICHRSIRSKENFNVYLKQSINILLKLLDYEDTDVQNAASESLDRICITYKDSLKVHVEFYEEINRNGEKRPLLFALKKFSELCSHIRPVKYKAFASKIFPCFTKICKREDVSQIQDQITGCLIKICPILCPYAADKDLISLMKEYIPLLNNDIVSIRRSFALGLATISQTSRRPHQFCQWLITNLLNQLAVEPTADREMFVSGVFVTLKFLFPKLKELMEQNLDESVREFFLENSIFIYQHLLSSLHYSNNNSVIVSAFEALQEMFINLPELVLNRILKIDSKTRLENFQKNDPLYTSNLSIDEASQSVPIDHFEDFPDENKLFEGSKLIGEEFGSFKKTQTSSSDCGESVIFSDFDDSNSMFQDRSETESVFDDGTIEEFDIEKSRSPKDLAEDENQKSRNSDFSEPIISSKSSEIAENERESSIETIDFGEMYSLEWATKLICARFLLKGSQGELFQNEVKPSIKILSLNFLSQIVDFCPKAVNLKFDTENRQQNISDIFLYSTDSDPNIRASVGLIISKVLRNNFKSSSFSSEDLTEIDSLFFTLKKLLNDNSGICLKQLLVSFNYFFKDALKDIYCRKYCLEMFPILLNFTKNNYWLLKIELLNFFADSCEELLYLGTDVLKEVLDKLFLKMLFCDDHRIRNAAVNGIIIMIRKVDFSGFCLWNNGKNNDNYDDDAVVSSKLKHFILNNFPHDKNMNHSMIIINLSLIVNVLLENFIENIHDKTSFLSIIFAFSSFVKEFPPNSFFEGWLIDRSSNSKMIWMEILSIWIEMLVENTFSILNDIQIHSEFIFLIQNLLSVLGSFYVKDDLLKNLKERKQFEDLCCKFYVHLAKIMVCYVSILESNSSFFVTFMYILHSVDDFQVLKIMQKTRMKSIKENDSYLHIRRLLSSRGSKKEYSELFEPIYYRFYDFLKSHYRNKKATIETFEQKFVLLSTCLQSFGMILPYCEFNNKFVHYEQILFYFGILYEIQPVKIIFCVKQLLKFVFNSSDESKVVREFEDSLTKQDNSFDANSLYITIMDKPYMKVNNLYQTFKEYSSDLTSHQNKNSIQELDNNCASNNCQIPSYSEQKNLNEKIFFFEPLVIESLKSYVNTNDRKLQEECIDLLSILVRLKVNYFQLDSNRTLIKCIYRQFDLMENIHDSRDYEELLYKLFDFLIILSRKSDSIDESVSIPKLLQFCDLFIANNHQKLAVIGLDVLSNELYSLNIQKYKEQNFVNLEAEREVLLAYSFKLIHMDGVLNILERILLFYRKNSIKEYEEISLKIFEQIHKNIKLFSFNNFKKFNEFTSFLFTLNRSVMNEELFLESIIDRSTFENKYIENKYYDEEYGEFMSEYLNITTSLTKMLNFTIFTLFTFGENEFLDRIDKFCNSQHTLECKKSAESLFIESFLNAFTVGCNHLIKMKSFLLNYSKMEEFNFSEDYLVFLLTQISFMMTFIFQSGFFSRLTSGALKIFSNKNSLSGLECLLKKTIHHHSMLTISWLNALFILNYKEFYPILERITSVCRIKCPVVKRFSIIFCCDYLTEEIEENASLKNNKNPCDVESILQQLFHEHLRDVIEMSENELPVKEFIHSVQRHSIASGYFIKSITNYSKSIFVKKSSLCLKSLKCLERIHRNESYSLINLLIECFLLNKDMRKYLGCCKIAETMVIDRLESLFCEASTNVLSLKSINNMKLLFSTTPFFKLNNCIENILSKFYYKNRSNSGILSVPINDPLNASFSYDNQTTINEVNREWFCKLLKNHFKYHQNNNQKSDYFFNKLNVEEILNLMNCQEFMLSNQSQIIKFVINFALNQDTELICLIMRNKNVNSSFHLESKKYLVRNILEWNLSFIIFVDNMCLQDKKNHLNHAQQKEFSFESSILVNALKLYIPTLTLLMEHLYELESFSDYFNISNSNLDLTIFTICSYFLRYLIQYQQSIDDILQLFMNCLFNQNFFLKLTSVDNFEHQSTFVNSIHILFEFYFETSTKTHMPEVFYKNIKNGSYCQTVKQLLELFSCIEHNCHWTSNKHLTDAKVFCLEKIILKLCHSPLVHSLVFVVPSISEQIDYEKNHFFGSFGCEFHMNNLSQLYSNNVDALRQLQFRLEYLSLNSLEFAGEIWNMLLQIFSLLTSQLYDVHHSKDVSKAEINYSIETLVECIRTMVKMIHFSSIFGHTFTRARFDDDFIQNPVIIDSKWGGRAEFIMRYLHQEELKIYKNSTFHKRKNFKRNNVSRSANFDIFIDSSCPLFLMEQFHHLVETFNRENFLPFPILSEIIRATMVLILGLPFGGSGIVSRSPYDCSFITLGNENGRCHEDMEENLQQQWSSCTSWIERGMTLIDHIWQLAEPFEDKIIESMIVMIYAKIFSLVSTNNDLTTHSIHSLSYSISSLNMTIEKYRKNLLENSSKDFYFPLRFSSIKAINIVCSSVERSFFTESDIKTLENVIKFCYENSFPNSELESVQWTLFSLIFHNQVINQSIDKEFQRQSIQILLKNLSNKNCYQICHALESFCRLIIIQSRRNTRQQQQPEVPYQKNFNQFFTQKHQQQSQQQHHYQSEQQQQQQQNLNNQTNESMILIENEIKQINEISLNELTQCHYSRDKIALLRLYIFSLYTVTALRNNLNGCMKRSRSIISPIEFPTSPETIPENETLFSVMEQLSVIFDLLTHCNTRQGTLLCQILGHFLVDFFPAQDILNKCIGQFLSNQQNHYKHLTNVLFVIFNKFQNDFLNTDIAQDWVVWSLSSFTQIIPISHSLWALTCFFAAASQNHWIRSSFPAFQERFGQFNSDDQKQFVIVCNNFFNEIKSSENKAAFVKTFQQVSSQSSNSPYFEVLLHLKDL